MKTIPIPIDRVVAVVENHGGYRGGACLACGALGWLEGKYGHPFGANVMSNRLVHKKECPMNAEINYYVEQADPPVVEAPGCNG